jgi:hypothetical protein
MTRERKRQAAEGAEGGGAAAGGEGRPARVAILFFTSSHAFRAEKLVRAVGIACDLVPVPRELSSDCGVCLLVGAEDRERGREILVTGHVEIAGIHEI